MIAICLNSSFQRGLGHLFRSLNLIQFLNTKSVPYRLFINDDIDTRSILEKKSVPYETVDLVDQTSNWETSLIQKYRISLWWNDRMETNIPHSKFVKQNGIALVTLDDMGQGAQWADIHIMPFALNASCPPAGKRILTGPEYLILNPEIDRYKRIRQKGDALLVSMGGSDTYGMTLAVLRCLKQLGLSATLHIGPLFQEEDQLHQEAGADYPILHSTPSLIAELADFDLAITGGGMTPFEANASGLPCLVISNEEHERLNGIYLERIGSSVYLGHRDQFDLNRLKSGLEQLDVLSMSQAGLEGFTTQGLSNIWKHLEPLFHE